MKHPVTARTCKEAQRALSVNMREISKLAKVGLATWHRYASGKVRPDNSVLDRIAPLLGLASASELIVWAHASPRRRKELFGT